MENESQQDYEISTYEDFWPIYLREHLNDTCRTLHYIGSFLALSCLIMLFMTRNIVWLLIGLTLGYGCAWIGHYMFEHNKPATFKYPLWSFISDWKMVGLWLKGDLDDHLERVRNLPSLDDIEKGQGESA